MSDDVYYRLYQRKASRKLDEKVVIVEMQEFDECDYDQNRFIVDPDTGMQLKFNFYEDAIKWLNLRIKPEHIHPDHLMVNSKEQQSHLFK